MFFNNERSFFAHSSDVIFEGESHFEGGMSDCEDGSTECEQEGGAISAVRSTITILDKFSLRNNAGQKGGGIFLTESFLVVNGQCTLIHNCANISGGAISAYKSNLKFSGDTNIQGNIANENGGGIFLVRSSIEYHSHCHSFSDNSAIKGGAIYFDQASTLYIVKESLECDRKEVWYCVSDPKEWLQLSFSGNSAVTGGALYVNDDHADSCQSKPYETDNVCNECFIQTVASYTSGDDWGADHQARFANINFTSNTAVDNGSLLYGGLLDRCAVDKFAELRQISGYTPHPFSYFEKICLNNFTEADLASDPVRICFCSNGSIDCSKPPPEPSIKRGETITVTLVVVDMMNKSLNSFVSANLLSESSRLSENQSKHKTLEHCTDLQFTVYSAAASETLSLYAAEGPCLDVGISKVDIPLEIIPGCPVGFSLSDSSLECTCDPKLLKVVNHCFIETESVVRHGNAWIGTWNASNSNDSDECLDKNDSTCIKLFLHPYCPYDYCYPPTQNVIINLNSGSDDQCAFHRTGSLCGCCDTKGGYSLTLGSSRCEKCTNHWLLLIVPFALAGVGLVVLMMFCNLTVAAGTLNGFLFYANILIANHSTFFPFEEQSVLTVFVSWLGLNLGIATCFYDGMDAVMKVWLQISFEVYLFVLMIVIILLGKNIKVATFFHKNNLHPVHTLATLVLLSYEKLSHKLFTLIASTTLTYPNGEKEKVWLFDPCLKYDVKLIPLTIVAVCIIFTGVVFNFILLFNKLLIARCQSVYFNTFMASFFAPFKTRHNYWVGLLLLLRNLSYVTSEVLNAGGNPSYNLHIIFTLVVGLLLIKLVYVSMPDFTFAHIKGSLLRNKQPTAATDLTERESEPNPTQRKSIKGNGIVYKSPFLDILETSLLVNLLVLTFFTVYLRDENQTRQNILFNISASIVLLTFVCVLFYHVCVYTFVSSLLRRCKRTPADGTMLLHDNSGNDYGSTKLPTHTEIHITS